MDVLTDAASSGATRTHQLRNHSPATKKKRSTRYYKEIIMS